VAHALVQSIVWDVSPFYQAEDHDQIRGQVQQGLITEAHYIFILAEKENTHLGLVLSTKTLGSEKFSEKNQKILNLPFLSGRS
jgi:hypothetical protein